MSRITRLPDHVINQIAAGEVVERPVAVVKELVENALDAEADRVEVTFEQGGKARIRVTDNGYGMDEEEARLALERHATSKILKVEDILKVGSFGFRGEALPSIASVSRFTLKTRRREDSSGTEIQAHGGKLSESRDCGMPPGTIVEVRQLFHSVPARRKFLKTDRTESAHIVQLCRLLAVAHPQVAFTLVEDGRTVFQSPACPDVTERVREIFGKQRAVALMPIDYSQEPYHLSGLISKIGEGRSTKGDMVTFVNERPVDSRLLDYALIESYHTYLPRGRYPLSFLFLKLPPEEVDVNVHPSKREVRFRDEGKLRRVVMQGLLDALQSAGRQKLSRAEFVQPEPKEAEPSERMPGEHTEIPSPSNVPSPAIQPDSGRKNSPASPETTTPRSYAEVVDNSLQWKFRTPITGGFGVFESDDGLLILNPQHARERIYYESILETLEKSGDCGQNLLFPIVLELDPLASDAVEEHLQFFHKMGFQLESFGRNVYRLRTFPGWFGADDAETFVRDLIMLIRERGLRPDQVETARQTVAGIAARRLASGSPPEDSTGWTQLARQLLSCRNPLTDPRGRNTIFELSQREIRRKFGIES